MFKYAIGSRVYPCSKTVGCSIGESQVVGRAILKEQTYLCVVDYDEVNGLSCYVLSDREDSISGDFFLEEDIRPWFTPEYFYKELGVI